MTELERELALSKALDLARLKGREEAYATAMTEINNEARRCAPGSLAQGHCDSVRVVIANLYFDTLEKSMNVRAGLHLFELEE